MFQEVVSGIHLLRVPLGAVWTGVVLLKGAENILIDSGPGSREVDEVLVPALAREGLAPRDIQYLLNTHCHGDHIGGHHRFRQLSKAAVVCFEGAEQIIQDPAAHSIEIRGRFPADSPPPQSQLVGVRPDRLVGEGDLVAGRLRLIWTPGHDADAVCWYDAQTGTALTGDSVQGDGATGSGLAFYRDAASYLLSIKRLQVEDIENMVAAHHYRPFGEVAVGSAQVDELLAACRRCFDTYSRFIERDSSRHTIKETALALIDHIGNRAPEKLFLEMYTVAAHRHDLACEEANRDEVVR